VVVSVEENLIVDDPMVAIFGDWYQLAAELYLGGSSFGFKYGYLAIFYLIHYLLKPLYSSAQPTEKESQNKKQK